MSYQATMNAELDKMRANGLSIDGENAYKRDLLDAVTGALAKGKQRCAPPPSGHWLEPFYEMGKAEADERDAARSLPVGVPDGWPRLVRPAKVGAGVFSAGLSARLVVEAAYRQHEYAAEPPFADEQIKSLAALAAAPTVKESLSVSVVPDVVRTFLVECSECRGGMVNGNRLSLMAKRLLDEVVDAPTVKAEQVDDSVEFGFDDRSVRVSQEAYAIFLDRESALRQAIKSLQEQLQDMQTLAPSLPAAGSADLTASQCACGDEYPANSYGAGFMAANNGVCENCDAANSCASEPTTAAGSAVDVLLPALRQYRHNCGGDELIPGYDYEETNRIVAALSAQQSAKVADYENCLSDQRRLVRELDVLLNGEDGSAPQASLCDIVGQVSSIVRDEGLPLLAAFSARKYAPERVSVRRELLERLIDPYRREPRSIHLHNEDCQELRALLSHGRGEA